MVKIFFKNKIEIYKVLWPSLKRSLIYGCGCFIFSLGAKFFIDAKLGVDPLDVLVLGIVKHIGLTIGIVSGGIAIAFLALWAFWNQKWPPISPFITMSFVGTLIDIWNWVHLERYTTPALSPYPMLFVGLVLASYGSSLIIMSGIGIRIMDLVAITIVQKWKWSFFKAKMLFEVGFLSSGWLLGGPVGIGTVLFVCVVGPFIQPFVWANAKFAKLPNYAWGKEGKDLAMRVEKRLQEIQ
jgi:hypothetical protein